MAAFFVQRLSKGKFTGLPDPAEFRFADSAIRHAERYAEKTRERTRVLDAAENTVFDSKWPSPKPSR